jgi:hypothetical protein
MKPILTKGYSKYGADMGRSNKLPTDCAAPVKLHLQQLKLVDGDYDQGGAYWGFTRGTAIYCAFTEPVQGFTRGTAIYRAFTEAVQVFCRATDRQDAKAKVRDLLPNVSFFR